MLISMLRWKIMVMVNLLCSMLIFNSKYKLMNCHWGLLKQTIPPFLLCLKKKSFKKKFLELAIWKIFFKKVMENRLLIQMLFSKKPVSMLLLEYRLVSSLKIAIIKMLPLAKSWSKLYNTTNITSERTILKISAKTSKKLC